MVIPGSGCSGCISKATDFLKNNIGSSKIFFIVTRIEDVKLVNIELGTHERLFLDRRNELTTLKIINIYPIFITLDDNKIVDILTLDPKISEIGYLSALCD